MSPIVASLVALAATLGEYTVVRPERITAADETVMNARQYSCIRSALTALQNAVENIELTPDVLLCDVEEAIESLSVMTGKTVSEEIIENIFSRFCVGK